MMGSEGKIVRIIQYKDVLRAVFQLLVRTYSVADFLRYISFSQTQEIPIPRWRKYPSSVSFKYCGHLLPQHNPSANGACSGLILGARILRAATTLFSLMRSLIVMLPLPQSGVGSQSKGQMDSRQPIPPLVMPPVEVCRNTASMEVGILMASSPLSSPTFTKANTRSSRMTLPRFTRATHYT